MVSRVSGSLGIANRDEPQVMMPLPHWRMSGFITGDAYETAR